MAVRLLAFNARCCVSGFNYEPVRQCSFVSTATSLFESCPSDIPVPKPWLGTYHPVLSPIDL
jgi:hypothetical protein